MREAALDRGIYFNFEFSPPPRSARGFPLPGMCGARERFCIAQPVGLRYTPFCACSGFLGFFGRRGEMDYTRAALCSRAVRNNFLFQLRVSLSLRKYFCGVLARV